MKKILLLAVAAMMTAMSANAQEGYNTKHEVAISYGSLSNSEWIDDLEKVTTAMFGASYGNEKFTGPFSAEYFYHTKNWLGLGGIFVMGKNTQDVFVGGNKDGKLTHHYFTLMPAAKFDWLRKKHFGMYSKVALGVTLRNESLDSDNSAVSDDSNSDIHVNWQLSFVGMEFGSPTLRGFVETGVGEQGIALIGVRYKF